MGIVLMLSACGNESADKAIDESIIITTEDKDHTETTENDESGTGESNNIDESESGTDTTDAESESQDKGEASEAADEEQEVNVEPEYEVYKDEASGNYGFALEDEPVTEAVYGFAEAFRDGYAVVSDGNPGVDGAYVVNMDFEKVLSHQLGIYNYGFGYFGLVQDYQQYNEAYNQVILVDSSGQAVIDERFYEVDVLNEEMILVANHLEGRLIDNNGKTVPPGIADQQAFKTYEKATVEEDYFILYKDSYDESEYLVVNTEGMVIESTVKDSGPAPIDLGDGYSVESYVAFDSRFVSAVLPQISKDGNDNLFRPANEWFLQIFDPVNYLDMPIEESWMEEEVRFEAKRIGKILELTLHYYWYGFGAAHPNYSQESYQIDLETGNLLELGDLMNYETAYTELTAKVQAKAAEEGDIYLVELDEIVVDMITNYSVSEDGISIYYNPYEIGPYAMGIPSFDFTFEELGDLVNKESDYFRKLVPVIE